MVTTVIVINVLIALMCLYATWVVWKLRRTFSKLADALLSYERSAYNTLHGAPKAIAKGELGSRSLRQQYQKLQAQLQRVQQILGLIGLAPVVWQRRSLVVRRPTVVKSKR